MRRVEDSWCCVPRRRIRELERGTVIGDTGPMRNESRWLFFYFFFINKKKSNADPCMFCCSLLIVVSEGESRPKRV
jgi:hypothetical protein